MSEQQWRHYPDSCNDCGNDMEIFTESGEEGFAFEADPVRCVECGAKGIISIFGDGDDCSVEIQWVESAGGASE